MALDAELNVFVRDNENDGGDYKIRVCHSFFGADHGYPYNYYERPDEALPPLADLGLGSSAGGVCYLEPQFPAEYRGNLFFCEWGKSLVRYQPAARQVEQLRAAEGDRIRRRRGQRPLRLQADGRRRAARRLAAGFRLVRRPAAEARAGADLSRSVHGRAKRAASSIESGDVSKASVPELLKLLDSESYWVRCDAQAAIEPG